MLKHSIFLATQLFDGQNLNHNRRERWQCRFQTELSQSDMFDQRLVAKVIKVVDVSYGGENGFSQVFRNLFFLDRELINFAYYFRPSNLPPSHLQMWNFTREETHPKYFDEISQDTGKYCFGIDDTLKTLKHSYFGKTLTSLYMCFAMLRYVLFKARTLVLNTSFLEEIIIHANVCVFLLLRSIYIQLKIKNVHVALWWLRYGRHQLFRSYDET